MATTCKKCGGRVSDVGDNGCPHLGARERFKDMLFNRADQECDKLLNMTDEEIMRDAVREHGSPEKVKRVANDVRRLILHAIQKVNKEHPNND